MEDTKQYLTNYLNGLVDYVISNDRPNHNQSKMARLHKEIRDIKLTLKNYDKQ